jgi:hypothetical protein
MTVSYGRHYSEAMLKWGKETLKELDAIETATKSKAERERGSRKLKR